MNIESSLSTLQHKICGSYCSILCVLGLLLNGYVLSLIYRQKKRRNLLNTNLTLINFLMCLTFPLNIISHFNGKWSFSQPLCTLYGFLSLLFGFVQLMSIPLIAVDEYLHVCLKQTNKQHLQRTQWMSIFTWFNSAFWSMAPLYGWSRITMEVTKTSCGISYKANDGYESYVFASFTCCYLLPCVFLIYSKLKITHSKSEKSSMMSKKALLLFGIFTLCWSPCAFVYLWPLLSKTQLDVIIHAWAPLIAKTAAILLPCVLIKMDYSQVTSQSPKKYQ